MMFWHSFGTYTFIWVTYFFQKRRAFFHSILFTSTNVVLENEKLPKSVENQIWTESNIPILEQF